MNGENLMKLSFSHPSSRPDRSTTTNNPCTAYLRVYQISLLLLVGRLPETTFIHLPRQITIL